MTTWLQFSNPKDCGNKYRYNFIMKIGGTFHLKRHDINQITLIKYLQGMHKFNEILTTTRD